MAKLGRGRTGKKRVPFAHAPPRDFNWIAESALVDEAWAAKLLPKLSGALLP